MRAPAVSFVRKIAAAAAVGLLACGLALPQALAFAEGEDAPSALLASSLMDGSASVVREDVTLAAPEGDAVLEPVIGSFTVDGLTFAVTEGANVQLVGVSPDWQKAMGLQAGEGSSQPSMPASEAEGSDAGSSALLIPESVSYNNVEYSVTSIGAYAFYLSGVTSVELPATVTDVDDRAFRSSDVASVEAAGDNLNYSSFDGALYDAEQLSLLLIPEGKQGTVLLPSTAESAAPSVFSHCPLVTQVSVEEGSAAFASENGLLYTSDLTTLLRVPAGATEITIREGCATIAAGAMEACASLATINAPASVTSISPCLFEQQPETVMAPVAVAAVEDDAEGDSADEGEPAEVAPQLSAMVALSSVDDELPALDASAIDLVLPTGADDQLWQAAGFMTRDSAAVEVGKMETSEQALGERASSVPALAVTNSAPAHVVDDDVPILSDVVALSSAAASRAEWGWSPKSTKQVTGWTLQIGACVTYDTSPATVINGKFNGTIAWTSDNNEPLDTDVVTITVKSFKPFNETTSGNDNDYSWDSVVEMCKNRTKNKDPLGIGYTPTWISALSTGYEVSLYRLFHLTSEDTWQFVILGKDLGGKEKLSQDSPAIIGQDGYGVALQYSNNRGISKYNYIDFEKNTNDTVLFNGHKGRSCASPATVFRGPVLTRAGYRHLGWSVSPSAQTAAYGPGQNVLMPFDQDTKLYAVWAKKDSHTVTLDKNEGSSDRVIYYWPDKGYTTSSDSTDVIGSGSVIVPSSDLPVRDGYDFAGYYSERTGGNQYIDKDGKLTSNAGALSKEDTWFAHWTPTECRIKLVTYGGTVSVSEGWKEVSAISSEGKRYEKTYTIESDDITLPIPQRDDYYFAGWTGPGDTTPSRDVVIAKGNTGTVEYKANYERLYTVTYSSAHGTPSKSSDQIRSSSRTVTLPTVPTVDDGYTFNGWKCSAWTGSKAGGSSFTFASAADRAVTADFTPVDYTITLNTKGGSISNAAWTAAPDNSKYTRAYNIETSSFTLPTPSLTGYTFTGWTGPHDTTPQTSVSIPKGTTGNMEYTANWKPNVYKITLNDNGGEGGSGVIYEKYADGWYASSTAEVKYAINSVQPPAMDASKGNYVFNGYFWTDSKGGRIQCIDSTGKIVAKADQFAQDAALVAEWAPIAGVGIHANGGYLKYNNVTWQDDFCFEIRSVKECEITADNSLRTLATDGVPRTIGSGDAAWKLLGWSTSPNGPLLPVGNLSTDKDVVYYAQWERPAQLAVFANGGALVFPNDNHWSGGGAWGFGGTIGFTIGGNAKLTVNGMDAQREVSVFEKECDQKLLGWSWTPNGAILEPGTYVISDTTLLYAVWGGSVDLWLHANSGALRYSGQCHWNDVSLPDGWRFYDSLRYVVCEDGSIKVFDKANNDTTDGRHTIADKEATDRILLGWAYAPTGPRISTGTYGGIGKVDLYAFWQTSTVSFDPNGGSGGQSDSLPVTVGEAMPAISKEKPIKTGYSFKGWFDEQDCEGARQYYTEECDSARQWDIGCDTTLYAGWEAISYTVSLEGTAGEDLGTFTVKYGEDLELPKLESQGWIFKGWEDAETGDMHQPGAVRDLRSEDGAHVVLRAKRVAAVSADALLDVTVSVDLLGIEDQVPASGYIESRSGGALKVVAVDFTPLDGATALFGESAPDVFLEALAGEGATSADVRFSLGSKATETDSTKLVAFALPDGFGTRIPIGYRFAIPDDVLGAIDPATFEDKKTPACSVYYTVALVNQEGEARR